MTARQDLPLSAPIAPLNYEDHYTMQPRKSWLRRWFVRLLLMFGGLAMVVSVLLPAMCGAREPANRIKCANNLRQIALAATMYAQSNGGFFPKTLDDLRGEELGSAAFECPSDSQSPDIRAETGLKMGLSYFYVGDGLKPDMENADTAVIAYEPLTNHSNEGMTIHLEALADHKNDGMNVAFADAHVEWIAAPDVAPILKQAAAGIRPIRFPQNAH